MWDLNTLERYLPLNDSSELVVDFETTGLDPWKDEIVGAALADDRTPEGIYFQFEGKTRQCIKELMKRIRNRPKTNHNITFDATMEEMWWRKNDHFYVPMSAFNWKFDTLSLMNQCEGDWKGKGLKRLQTVLLGWEEQGDVYLDEWLVENGYHVKGKAQKEFMHKAPYNIMSFYAGLDAQSTLALKRYIFDPILQRFPDMEVYHSRDFMTLIELVVEQRLRGMQINTEYLSQYITYLEWIADTLEIELIHHSEASPHIKRFNQAFVDELIAKEPPKHKKNGGITKRWETWKGKVDEASSQNWFKIGSKTKDLPWLLYDNMFETNHILKKNWRKEEEWWLEIHTDDGIASVKCNSQTHRPVDLEILPRLGNVGQILYTYSKTIKELGYCRSALEHSNDEGILHPQLRVSGTKTDRCSGTGGINLQQMVKTYDFMKCFTHREGHTLVQMDIDALEAVVLAELSEDKAYMKLYGPDAKKGNDVYLFVGSGLGDMGRPILDDGYDPDNPDPDIVKECKKKHKGLRGIYKKFHLSGQYGAGPFRIWSDLRMAKVDVSLDQCKEMHKNYWKLFEDVVSYVEGLQDERVANSGWVLDGIGTPVTVQEAYTKDILNRVIQRTGHMILVRYLYHLNVLRKESGIGFFPILADFHDETVWECKTDDVPKVMEIFKEAWVRTNKELGGIIPLSGDPETCDDWRAFKVEDKSGIMG